MGEAQSRRYRDRRIVSSYEFPFFPREPESDLDAYIGVDKWTNKSSCYEIVWSSPGFPWIFSWIDSEFELPHTHIVREHLDPLSVISCWELPSSYRRRESRSLAVPVRVADPRIDIPIEGSGIRRTTVIESYIFSLKPEYFYISDTVLSCCRITDSH
jgi:hypothetical protein